jgi:hypothetical protein
MYKSASLGARESSNPPIGSVPARGTATFALMPVASLCKEIQQAGLTNDVPLRVDVEATSGGVMGATVIDTIHPYHP